jgi:hypothetical protein
MRDGIANTNQGNINTSFQNIEYIYMPILSSGRVKTKCSAYEKPLFRISAKYNHLT